MMMAAAKMENLEIEHKYVIDPKVFPLDKFQRRALELAPEGESHVLVEDTYFILASTKTHIFRHRFDSEIQNLTVKSLTGDVDVRLEVNLDLDQGKGNQLDRVREFLRPLGIIQEIPLKKEVHAYYLKGCEAVYYKASGAQRSIFCVEFEATEKTTLESSKRIIAHYENEFGFNDIERASESLFELLIVPQLPKTILQSLTLR